MRNVWYHQIWILNYLGFIVSDLIIIHTFSSPLISTLICNRMAPETLDLSERFSKLYQTSISPDKVLTSIMVWPRKSSDSLVNFCLNLDFKSLSSSQTRTLIRSDELWHSLQKKYHTLLISSQKLSRSANKVRTFWETHKIWKNLPLGFDKSADLLSKPQN